jgi:preprotein translocase subunit SecB
MSMATQQTPPLLNCGMLPALVFPFTRMLPAQTTKTASAPLLLMPEAVAAAVATPSPAFSVLTKVNSK